MRFKLFVLGLLLSASGSLVAIPAAADWNARGLTLEARRAGNPSGSTRYLCSGHAKGLFAVRSDYDNIPLMKGNPFSGVEFLNCENSKSSEFCWNAYILSEKINNR